MMKLICSVIKNRNGAQPGMGTRLNQKFSPLHFVCPPPAGPAREFDLKGRAKICALFWPLRTFLVRPGNALVSRSKRRAARCTTVKRSASPSNGIPPRRSADALQFTTLSMGFSLVRLLTQQRHVHVCFDETKEGSSILRSSTDDCSQVVRK